MKRWAPIIICCAILVAATSSRVAAAEEWRLTLDDAVKRALEENRDIQVARERLVELAGIKGEARAMGLPQLTGTGSIEHIWRRPVMIINGQPVRVGNDNTFTAAAEATQLLWDGGRVFKAVKAARAEEVRGIETVRDAEEQIRLQVKQTYYQILYTTKVIDVLERQLRQLKGHLAAIGTRFREGIESDYTLMRQQVEVANIEPQLIDAKRMHELLINGIKILLAIPLQDTFVPTGDFGYRAKALPPLEALVEMSQTKRPDLNAEKLRMKSLEQLVGVEKSAWWPQLSVAAGWQWQGYSDGWDISPNERTDTLHSTLSLSWPIFDGLKTASRVKQAKARHLQQIYLASQMEDQVVREARDAYESLLRAREALQTQCKSYQLARRATAIASERFGAGLMSQLELNDTIQAQARAEQLHLQATFDCLVAEAALEKAVGGAL